MFVLLVMVLLLVGFFKMFYFVNNCVDCVCVVCCLCYHVLDVAGNGGHGLIVLYAVICKVFVGIVDVVFVLYCQNPNSITTQLNLT